MIRTYIGESNCDLCGKSHKKIVEIDGKKYGTSCANKILKGQNNYSAPLWLYESVEKYLLKDYKTYSSIEDAKEFCFLNWYNNFFDVQWSVSRSDQPQLFSNSVKVLIDGKSKSIKLDWQWELQKYCEDYIEELINLD